MKMNTWIIATDPRRIYGMVAATRPVSESITVAVVGSLELAEELAKAGVDALKLFEIDNSTPAETLAPTLAALIASDGANLVLGNDSPETRVLLGAASAAIDTTVLGALQDLKEDEAGIIATNAIASGNAVEEIAASAIAGIYTGPDADPVPLTSCPIDPISFDPVPDQVVGFEEASGSGLDNAARVVGAGMGVGTRSNLPLIEDLAKALDAEIACSLPLCDDMHWFGSDRVVGSSHRSIAPDLYLAVGISGSPNHISGIRDTKTIVAINNDPEAKIFNASKYGIVADLNEVVPELIQALSS